MSTAYVGTFPKHLDEIAKLVERTNSRLCIMAECVDYGSFSAPKTYESVLQSIKAARGKRPEVKVQILLCGDWQHFSRSSPYFGRKYEDLLTDPEFVTCLNSYVLLAAIAPLIGLMSAIIWERNRRRRTEKPPQTEKLLRPPGYSLSLRFDKIFDGVMNNFLASCGFSTMAGMCVITLGTLFSLRAPVLWLVICVLFLTAFATVSALAAVKAFRGYKAARNVRLGISGEQAVAEALNEAADSGFRAFHDLPAGTIGTLTI